MSKLSRYRVFGLLLVAAFLLAAGSSSPSRVSAQGPPLSIRMATVVPTNSSYFQVLREVADKWLKLSNGRVKVTLFGGSTKGDDPEVVTAMRGNELQGAVLTSVGLGEIDRSIYALSIPMAYNSYEEVYYVLGKMRPRLEKALDAQGFVVLNWADGGWVHFFTKKPVATPDDLKKLKLFQWAGDPKSLAIWHAAGFNAIAAQLTDLLPNLQTGMFEACGMSPQVAAIGHYYDKDKAPFMTDMNWAVLLGATVVRKDTWAKVPADVKPALLKAMDEAGTKLRAEIRKSGESDVAAMKAAGLTVVPVDARTTELWRKIAESVYGKIRGDFVPADAFDEAMKYRDEYRKTAPKK